MTVLRHQMLDSDGNPLAGRVADVSIYDPKSAKPGLYQKNKTVAAVSNSTGWLNWTLPSAPARVWYDTSPVYVVTGIEEHQVLISVPTALTTATVEQTRIGTLDPDEGKAYPNGNTDLVTEDELLVKLGQLGVLGPETTDAGDLIAGLLDPDRIGDRSLPLTKLDTDIATQAELNALATSTSNAIGGKVNSATYTAGLAAAKNRVNHTGTQTAATISDFTEAVQDAVAALLGAGSNVIVNYDDASNSMTISSTGAGSTGLDAEAVRDAIGIALVGVGNITVTANDAADTITVTTKATVNSTDAQLRDRSTHTGLQPATTITGLAAVATSGNYADLIGKPATTGGTAVAYTDEQVRDVIGAALIAGSGISILVNDAGDQITIAATATPNPAPTVANLPAGTTLTVLKPAGGAWPARPTSRADVVVAWKGPDPSPAIVSTGTSGMLNNVDYRLVTP